jgi:hypothetical protein
VVFVLIFWSLWLFIFRPLSSSLSADSSSTTQASQEDQNQKSIDKYMEQARTTDKLLAESAAQQHRMAAVISKQEDLLKRHDQVMNKWEQQAGIRK